MENVVLAIDDEPALLEIIQKVASSANYVVHATTEPGVFQATLSAQPPSVVLLDLQMPDCDGIELLRVLAEMHCRAKIILVSGFDARVLSLAKEVGRDLGLDMGEPVEKPLRPAQLKQILSSLRNAVFRPDIAGLREAIDNDRLELFYQPLLTLKTGVVIGYEALVRWNHPEFGIVLPDLFITLAEQGGLIDALNECVLTLATADIASWRELGIESCVSVNVSALNITAGLIDQLLALCALHHIPPRLLRLEVTETAAMGHPATMLEVLTRIRLKGFELAIDDFGTGYSSLVQLRRLPFSQLKIDRSFVADLETSEDARVIVGAIVNLARNLRLESIAEGIETREQSQRLAEMGCDTGQGFLFSRPMPGQQIPQWTFQHRQSGSMTA
jgi:EAL domain-containing protein (putative c-di-GMP-specific phosphodiesterase class I)